MLNLTDNLRHNQAAGPLLENLTGLRSVAEVLTVQYDVIVD